jgi:hypothetical protein
MAHELNKEVEPDQRKQPVKNLLILIGESGAVVLIDARRRRHIGFFPISRNVKLPVGDSQEKDTFPSCIIETRLFKHCGSD